MRYGRYARPPSRRPKRLTRSWVAIEISGMTNEDEIPRLYLDANVFIYAIEGNADIADPLRQLFDLFRANRAIGVTSDCRSIAEGVRRTTTKLSQHDRLEPHVRFAPRKQIHSDRDSEISGTRWHAQASGRNSCSNRNPFRLPDSSLCRLAVETTHWVFRAITCCRKLV